MGNSAVPLHDSIPEAATGLRAAPGPHLLGDHSPKRAFWGSFLFEGMSRLLKGS
jgi:hypothetical protein